jgi:hypothetical protein
MSCKPSDLRSIGLNVIGGAVVAFLSYCYIVILRRFRQWTLKRILGADFDREGKYHIAFASFLLPPFRDQQGKIISHPYVKTQLPQGSGRQPASAGFSIANPVSGGEVRGIAYLAELFGKSRVCAPLLIPDNEIASKLDISFIALGGPLSNLKSEDTFGNSSNTLVILKDHQFVNPSTQQPVIQLVPRAELDYGVILRLSPRQHGSRTWIVCAGIDEWGTSASAWYLAYKWRYLFWHVMRGRRRDFAAIIRVRRGQDESAEIIWSDRK